ncbi:serpentine type 7TM GPCR chemoreceptor str domain-containing protein [Ditylenchus destructor]|uniref:Serpentine type 7TM GPCR chemoreceptor str domain-containing protein n=1 Tax=Ditylenchus destructor TaxID=166010 RepID=A0AAD4MNV9_9BILA|nr:serpentine type 7TM GPCR chemoreceptor str domain-containing protein [Ditylenchus destructor]
MIAKRFRELGTPTHVTIQKMHREFHRALLAMAICPLITSTGPIYYYSASFIFQLCPGKFSAIMSSAVSWITFFNPLTTILCFRCYRQTTLRFIACGSIKPTINPSSLPVNPTSNYVI